MTDVLWLGDAGIQSRWDRFLNTRPRCIDCGEPIVEDSALRVGDGELVCGRCERGRRVFINNNEK